MLVAVTVTPRSASLQTMTDRELLERARRLPEALGEFYDRYESAVAAYFMRRTRSAPAAHELTAETFAEVVLQVHRGAEIHEPTGWLFTIAHHKLADYHRRGAVDRRARNRLGIPRHGADDEALERVEALLEEPRAEPCSPSSPRSSAPRCTRGSSRNASTTRSPPPTPRASRWCASA